MTAVNDVFRGAATVLVKSANRIAVDARGFAKRAGSARIASSIRVTTPKITSNTAEITIYADPSIAPFASIFEKGAKPHPIAARNAPNLVFEGTNQFTGKLIVTKSVNHPGMKARSFMRPATEKNKAVIREDIRKMFGDAVRVQLISMSKKV